MRGRSSNRESAVILLIQITEVAGSNPVDSIWHIYKKITARRKEIFMQSQSPDINLVALIRNRDRYIFMYDDENYDEALRALGRFASNPELSFTWRDASLLAVKIKKLRELQSGGGFSFKSF